MMATAIRSKHDTYISLHRQTAQLLGIHSQEVYAAALQTNLPTYAITLAKVNRRLADQDVEHVIVLVRHYTMVINIEPFLKHHGLSLAQRKCEVQIGGHSSSGVTIGFAPGDIILRTSRARKPTTQSTNDDTRPVPTPAPILLSGDVQADATTLLESAYSRPKLKQLVSLLRQRLVSREVLRRWRNPLPGSVRARVLECIQAAPEGLTHEEVATRTGNYHSTVRGRIVELHRAGRLRDSGQSRPTTTGADATVWVAI